MISSVPRRISANFGILTLSITHQLDIFIIMDFPRTEWPMTPSGKFCPRSGYDIGEKACRAASLAWAQASNASDWDQVDGLCFLLAVADEALELWVPVLPCNADDQHRDGD